MAETQTLTLTGFLLARIAEIEADAKACISGRWLGDWMAHEGEVWDDGDMQVADPVLEALAAHIARNDPARVLAECEAKRRIVDAHASDVLTEPDEPEVRTDCRDCWQSWPCSTLRILAAVYADHPDYNPDWRP